MGLPWWLLAGLARARPGFWVSKRARACGQGREVGQFAREKRTGACQGHVECPGSEDQWPEANWVHTKQVSESSWETRAGMEASESL